MRRDNFTATIDTVSDDPMLRIEYDGPTDDLGRRLTDPADELYTAADVDAAFRLTEPVEASDAAGVFSLSHRVTGEFLLEANTTADRVFDLIAAARDADDGSSYQITIDTAELGLTSADTDTEADDEDRTRVVHELHALFVYDASGELLRQHSLIPSGVEI
ncbi:MAG: hypothetical protein J07HX5_01389 [halophilic archaeon J07HX5]|nr:MAG: hypothetical protein J07HX5_01389 [halophilic archaeon J07HX5]